VTEHGDDFTLAFEESAPGEGVGELVTLPGSSSNGSNGSNGSSDRAADDADEGSAQPAPTS
jgi:hypothetical protein